MSLHAYVLVLPLALVVALPAHARAPSQRPISRVTNLKAAAATR